jgi:hypothetical protein|tara:strand:+ start:47 stop:637 length:591 start_codon:yes stop_codon:yes gene_type:complete
MALTKVTGSGANGLTLSSTDVTVASGDLLFGTANKGVVLGATSNTAANTLDDYEFGTFDSTVTYDTTLTDTSPDETFTHSGNSYVKVGQMCYVAMKKLSRSDTFSGTDVIISSVSLPFTAVNVSENIYGTNGHYQYYITGQYSSSTIADGYIQTYVGAGASIATVNCTNLNNGGYFLKMSSSVSNIYISFCYRTAA